MNQWIKLSGIEIECKHNGNGKSEFLESIEHDGSLEFEGSCECNTIDLCSCCESDINYCECYQCRICNGCDYYYEECACDVERDEDCKDVDCISGEICESCYEIFQENQGTRIDCREAENVYFGDECECSTYLGEYVSKAIEPSKIQQFYNDIIETGDIQTNSSCGYHQHFSFKDDKISYQILANPEFYHYFMTSWIEFGLRVGIRKGSAFYRRIAGITHCYSGWNAKNQIKMQGKYDEPRYRHLNFCYNVKPDGNKPRKTLEIRLMPAFQNPKYTRLAIKETQDIINRYLDMTKKKREWKRNRIEIRKRIDA